ncbi:phage-like protein [Priestia megaterium]|nr:phage-like protein [Priestia megaterium]
MGLEQLTLLEPVDKKLVRQTVIRELKNYRALKVKLVNNKERAEEGIVRLFPVLRKEYNLAELKVKQIERALNHAIDFIERKIIELKYLDPYKINDFNIIIELGIKKGRYYEKKKTELFRLANALEII